ncbi:MAG TPA: beta-ketoacyl-[acyl-carrier-protein] synthase II [Deltaproteobacteria bacterium]|nr:beta-ketoacyl-[acyl-carrier-protein] synthase II [Deltaproteobacteria bacterium]
MKQVAVTGFGVVSPLGSDIHSFWEHLIHGRSGITSIPSFEELPVRFGGPAKGFDPSVHLSGKELRHTDRFTQMAISCGLDAYHHAGLTQDAYAPERIGVLVGSGAGGVASLEEQILNFNSRGPRRISPLTVTMFIGNMASGELAIRIGARGPGMGLATACATGGHAIAVAHRLIQCGDADCMIAGGVEACLTPFALSAFAAMKALSSRNDDPARASRPFDRDRDGFVMSEGGAVLVFEEYSRARERGATIFAEICGIGMSQDAYHIVAPDPEAKAIIYAMERAIGDAGVAKEDIGYINAHGTSTPLNDKTETFAIKEVFGSRAYDIPVSSTKSMTGHLIGGTASLETVICILALRAGMLPPTINLDTPDPECDLNYVPHTAIGTQTSYCLNNSFGFGGQNVALVIGKTP